MRVARAPPSPSQQTGKLSGPAWTGTTSSLSPCPSGRDKLPKTCARPANGPFWRPYRTLARLGCASRVCASWPWPWRVQYLAGGMFQPGREARERAGPLHSWQSTSNPPPSPASAWGAAGRPWQTPLRDARNSPSFLILPQPPAPGWLRHAPASTAPAAEHRKGMGLDAASLSPAPPPCRRESASRRDTRASAHGSQR